MAAIGIVYTTLAWIITLLIPGVFIAMFNGGEELMKIGVPSMRIYSSDSALCLCSLRDRVCLPGWERPKHAIFFSLLRKAVIVIPLTLLLPHVAGLGVNGVFLAEPISNFIGGTACFVTMLCVMWPALSEEKEREVKRKKQMG